MRNRNNLVRNRNFLERNRIFSQEFWSLFGNYIQFLYFLHLNTMSHNIRFAMSYSKSFGAKLDKNFQFLHILNMCAMPQNKNKNLVQ